MARTLLYFADPMCSWCWGFQPAMEKVRARIDGIADAVIFTGGLRPFTDHAMTDRDKDAVRNHWDHVHEASGQPFDYDFFERADFTYDTEPACRAIVAARRLDPGFAFPMLNRLHQAFYAENTNVTDSATLADLAAEVGIARGDFEIAHTAHETREETLADFHYAQRSQITGFPTLIGITEGARPSVLTIGFQPWEGIEPALEAWLAQETATA